MNANTDKHHILERIISHPINNNPVSPFPSHMASNSNMDIQGATQHLRDILKLDRAGNGTGKLNRELKRGCAALGRKG